MLQIQRIQRFIFSKERTDNGKERFYFKVIQVGPCLNAGLPDPFTREKDRFKKRMLLMP